MRLALGFLLMVCAAGIARAAETVEIPVGEEKLKATLYRPAGKTTAPAIVAMHGCGGLVDRAGKFRAPYQDWADKLTQAGFAVLFPDSFTSRGLGPQCTVQKRKVQPYRERVTDAHAARAWLQSQSWVQPDRVSLLGWSNGAVTVLWAVRPRNAHKDAQPDFRSAVAFYPSCRRARDAAWSARVPTLLLVGESDDWAPARECEQMIAGAKGRSALTEIVKYRNAHHYFDRANLAVGQRSGLAFTPDGTGRAHVGTDAEARADVLKRVPEWLSR